VTEADRLTSHELVATHVEDGLALFAKQFATRPRLEALLRAALASVQTVETDVWGLYALGIAESSGAALDQIGSLLLLARPASLSDADYRVALTAIVRAHRSSGTAVDLLAVARIIVGSYALTLSEPSPATVIVEPVATPPVSAELCAAILARGAPAGVALQVVDVPATTLFTFSADAELASSSSTLGFSDTAGSTGGALVGVVMA
jgi:hypothetical protein